MGIGVSSGNGTRTSNVAVTPLSGKVSPKGEANSRGTLTTVSHPVTGPPTVILDVTSVLEF